MKDREQCVVSTSLLFLAASESYFAESSPFALAFDLRAEKQHLNLSVCPCVVSARASPWIGWSGALFRKMQLTRRTPPDASWRVFSFTPRTLWLATKSARARELCNFRSGRVVFDA